MMRRGLTMAFVSSEFQTVLLGLILLIVVIMNSDLLQIKGGEK